MTSAQDEHLPPAFDPDRHPHRRFNPLTRSWVLVSPQRAQRPWQGARETGPPRTIPPHEPTCYLCPGNARAGGALNPDYQDSFVYDNDFPALLPEALSGPAERDGLFRLETVRGICRVLCYTPRHDLSISLMETEEMLRVVELWKTQCRELEALPFIQHVQVFENREGNSSPHPHGQIWATERVPEIPSRETEAQREWLEAHGRPLLEECLDEELKSGERLVCENRDFACFVPFWALWPYETLILPRRHFAKLEDMTAGEEAAFADILRETAIRYDNLFEAPFPYSMGIHQAPADGAPHPEWRLHVHFTSSVLRSIEVPKFMVGYERLGEPQRDFTPEWAAKRLRETPATHFRQRPGAP